MNSRIRATAAALILAATGLSTQAHASVTLANGGFEAPYDGYASQGTDGHVVFTYEPYGSTTGWSFAAGTGLTNSYDALSAYEGQGFAFIQNATEKFGQLIDVSDTAHVIASFALALRPGYDVGQVVGIMVDGQQVASVSATSSSWSLQHIDLGLLTAGTHTFGFRGLNPNNGRDTTAFIDAVKLSVSPVPEASSVVLAAFGMGVAALARRRQR